MTDHSPKARLKRIRNRCFIIGVVLGLLACIATNLPLDNETIAFLLLPLVFVGIAVMLFYAISGRCPYCRRSLWIKKSEWFGEYSDLSIPDQCPSCGKDLRISFAT